MKRKKVWIRCISNVNAELYYLHADLKQLFFVIHERVNIPPTALTPHLWSYRSRITLEHLSQVVSTQKETSPILHEFLTKVTQFYYISI